MVSKLPLLSPWLRVTGLVLNLWLGLWLWQLPGYWGATLLALLFAIWQTWCLEQSITREKKRFQQFLIALKQGNSNDYVQTSGSSQSDIAEAYEQLSLALNSQRTDQAAQLRYCQTLVESSPVPMISLTDNSELRLHNHAARQLLPNLTHERELAQFGSHFLAGLSALKPGQRQLLLFDDGTEQRQLMVQMTRLSLSDKTEKLYSLLDIQRELETAQLQAWQDLVRVLTHEMMNSITPIASLAKTANTLVEYMQSDPQVSAEDLADLRDATDTVARRADGLMQFVQRYRSLTLLPEPKVECFVLDELLHRCLSIYQQMDAKMPITYRILCLPKNLVLQADPQLLEQVVINLLCNAQQALEENKTNPATIDILANMNSKREITLAISDNGPGLDSNRLRDIFLPFYTTKSQGAGIGLALARQIMTVHGGSISASNNAEGGAKFTLNFDSVKCVG